MLIELKDFSIKTFNDKEAEALINCENLLNVNFKEGKRIEDCENLFFAGEDSDTEDNETNMQNPVFKVTRNIASTIISTGKYAGVIRFPNQEVTIQIGSRFDVHQDNSFFRYMLNVAFSERGKVFERLAPSYGTNELWDLLLPVLFKKYLLEALKQGLYKEYRKIEYNYSRPKGLINFAQHIKYNYPFENGKIVYTLREHTFDNALMHLILYAYEKIKDSSLISGPEMKTAIQAIQNACPTFRSNNIEKIVRLCSARNTHPYYYAYEPLRKICILILQNKGIDIFDNSLSEAYGVLVDIPWLWEQVVEKEVLKDIRTIQAQSPKGAFFKNTKAATSLRPDFTLENAVLDAKYKIGWEVAISDAGNFAKMRGDYFQLITYSTAYKKDICGVVFPSNDIEDIQSYLFVKNSNVLFIAIPIKIRSGNVVPLCYDRIKLNKILETLKFDAMNK